MTEEKNHDSLPGRRRRTVYVQGNGVWPTIQRLAALGFQINAGEEGCLLARKGQRVIEIRRLAD